jgi:endonuclease/exonuclease/phosphatase family metal-dependent hydrolase
MTTSIRVATYKIYKCQGLDRRTSQERIAAVIPELDSDIVALQGTSGCTKRQAGVQPGPTN